MRSSTLATLAAALLRVGHATAGPVSADYHDGKLVYRDGADPVSSSDNTVDYTASTPDAPADYEGDFVPVNDEIVGSTAVTKIVGRYVPGNAPPDFWMPEDHQVERPNPPGQHYEFMFCDRKFSEEKNVCGGTCHYVAGTVQNGEITLITPNTKCVVAPCDLEYEKCILENHLMNDDVICERAKPAGGPLANGMCLMKGDAQALRVAY